MNTLRISVPEYVSRTYAARTAKRSNGQCTTVSTSLALRIQQYSSTLSSASVCLRAASPHCFLASTGSNPTPGSVPLNAATVGSVRYARAGGTKFVWLTPVAVPLILSFAFIGVITYHQVIRTAESAKQNRPYGLLGPTVNVFLDDEALPSVERNVKEASIRPGRAQAGSSKEDSSSDSSDQHPK
jgi:hypothetical protein